MSNKSKAIRWIILCSFLMWTGYYLSLYSLGFLANVAYIVQFLLYPFAGCVGDLRWGRYKTIRFSLVLLMLISVILIIVCSFNLAFSKHPTLLEQNWAKPLTVTIALCNAIMGTIGVVAFFANVIPFATDQLRDAPTEESSLFVYMYIWTLNSSIVLYTTILDMSNFYRPDRNDRVLSSSGLMVLSFSVLLATLMSLTAMHRRQDWFNVEPVNSINPYKLVYRVTKFAWHHKAPVRRSAFTYCEDELPSRLDLGKTKYGGPFTTEEVEDVKVFYEILKVLVCAGSMFYATGQFLLAEPSNSSMVVSNLDFGRIFYNGALSSLVACVAIPLGVCLSRKFKLHIRSLRRMEMGTILMLVTMVFQLGVNIAAHLRNENLKCLLQVNRNASLLTAEVFSHLQAAVILAVQQGLNGLSRTLIMVALYEFICAQSPHSMKGALIGLIFAIQGIFYLLGVAVWMLFAYFWTSSYPSCGLVYYGINTVVGVAAFVALVRVGNRYKYRERDEPSRVRQFAEEYYSNIRRELHRDYSISSPCNYNTN